MAKKKKNRINHNSNNRPTAPQRQPEPPQPRSESAPETSTPTKTVKEPTASANPFYGCAILLIAVCTFGFIVTWTLYSGWKQNAEIGEFTVQDAPPLQTPEISGDLKSTMKMKLDAFAAVAKGGRPVTFPLTAEDLNTVLVLASESDSATDYRGMVRFTGIDAVGQALKADIRWKMNNLPFVQAPDRFLVGQATFKPVIENNALELHIENLTVPGKTVSEGFMRQLRTWPWLNIAKLKPEISAPLGKVTRFEFTADGTLFVLHCGETVPR